MRHIRSLVVALAGVTLLGPVTHAQGTGTPQVTRRVFNYVDDNGSGTLAVEEVRSTRTAGEHLITVSLLRNGRRFFGSGNTRPVSADNPETLISFTLVGPKGTVYVYHGRLMPGAGFTGQGTYHQVGLPEHSFRWRITGLAEGGGAGAGSPTR